MSVRWACEFECDHCGTIESGYATAGQYMTSYELPEGWEGIVHSGTYCSIDCAKAARVAKELSSDEGRIQIRK